MLASTLYPCSLHTPTLCIPYSGYLSHVKSFVNCLKIDFCGENFCRFMATQFATPINVASEGQHRVFPLCYAGFRVSGNISGNVSVTSHRTIYMQLYKVAWHGLASFSGPCRFRLHEERRGPDIFSHMHDVKGRKVENTASTKSRNFSHE